MMDFKKNEGKIEHCANAAQNSFRNQAGKKITTTPVWFLVRFTL